MGQTQPRAVRSCAAEFPTVLGIFLGYSSLQSKHKHSMSIAVLRCKRKKRSDRELPGAQ